MIQIPKTAFYLSPVVVVIEEIKNELSFLQPISTQYNYDEVSDYVEVIVDYEILSGIMLHIEITKFLDEAIRYSVISKSEIDDLSIINYYVEDLTTTVTKHISLLIEHQYLKTLSMYE